MLDECIECGSKEFETAEKDIVLRSGNPSVLIVKSECIVCKGCGNKYFDEKQMSKLSKKVKEVA